jgi:two-component system sensor histidine kinase HydH
MLRRRRLGIFEMGAAPPPGFRELQQAELGRVFGRVVGVRLMLMPILVTAAIALAIYEEALWRRVVLACFVCAVAVISVLELWRYKRNGLLPGALGLNVGVGLLAQLTMTATTGGLESPFLPLTPVLSFFTGLGVERASRRVFLVGAQVLALWAFAVIALTGAVEEFNLSIFGGGSRAGHNDVLLLTLATVASLMLVVAAKVGAGMRSVFGGMLWKAFEAREESLRAHAERSREMTALSGEIAHELKNPLASVKGLGALLARELPEGKNAERLAVLRREIDRMQGILDEFLNFSRPLVPLSLEQTELASLAAEVAALHEGMARERKIAFAVRGEARAQCDPRKVRQVLINLVQNALDASPAGATVEVEVVGEAEYASVRVADRGAGIDPAMGDRIFEPGVTSKPRGSGLGLTIARALARQHGGDLALRAREGGGCVAEVRLPRAIAGEPSTAEEVSA